MESTPPPDPPSKLQHYAHVVYCVWLQLEKRNYWHGGLLVLEQAIDGGIAMLHGLLLAFPMLHSDLNFFREAREAAFRG